MNNKCGRILLIDTNIDGHHFEYLAALANSLDDCVVCVPEKIVLSNRNAKVVVLPYNIEKGGLSQYIRWIMDIKQIAKEECIDVIHFLTADFIVKYFGLLLNRLQSHKVILTFHHFKHSRIRDFARKCLCKKADINIVHTDVLLEEAKKKGMHNFVKITYPCFLKIYNVDANESRDKMGIPIDNKKVLSAIGATRYDKGLDILLEALRDLEEEFYLLIAGKENYFSRDFIESKITSYKDNVVLRLNYLSDEDMFHALNCSDIVVLPYRKSFDGASGPLTDAVYLGKKVIGPNHGSLGDVIKKYNLGWTFDVENPNALCNSIEAALKDENSFSDKRLLYLNAISTSEFIRRNKELYFDK